jgi:hypothetical protein
MVSLQYLYQSYIWSNLLLAFYLFKTSVVLYRYSHGVSVVSDGWTNMKNQPLINVMASNSCGSMFLYAEDFSGQEKTGEAIAEFLLQAIEEIGPANVLQVVTDNASNCKVAGREIQKVCVS